MRIKLKHIEDQVVVITGASSGIGLTTARMAAARGARLGLISRSEGALKTLQEELCGSQCEVMTLVADVSDFDRMSEAARAIKERFGRIDTWVNNAGISVYGRSEEVPLEDQRRVMEVSFWGVVHGALAALPYLKEAGGALINVGSVASDRAIPLQGVYCAAKHAVKGYTDTLRMEIEKANLPISVTLIKPASVDTPFVEHAKNYMQEEANYIPPIYAPEIVAEAILHAATHPIRDIFVGGAAKLMSSGQTFPRISDKVMEKMYFEAQHKSEPNDDTHESLLRPSEDLRERSEGVPHVLESSLYTKASMHPTIATMCIAAGAAFMFTIVKNF